MRFDFECPVCHLVKEIDLKLAEVDREITCPACGNEMSKLFNKITPTMPAQVRKWGTSLWRSHSKGSTVKKPALPTYIPATRKEQKDGNS